MKTSVLFAGFALIALLSVSAPRASGVPVSDATAHQLFADARDTTLLTGFYPEHGDGAQSIGKPDHTAYRRVTYIRFFYYDTDGNRVYVPGAEYFKFDL